MWRRLSCARVPSRPGFQRVWASNIRKKKTSSLFEEDASYAPSFTSAPPTTVVRPLNRLTTILVSFAAGFSVYFFLEDPSHIPPPLVKPSISSSQYVSTKLMSSEVSGPDTKLLKIAAPPHLIPRPDSNGTFDPVWSIYIKDDDIQVERPYTPLNGVDKDGNMLFWIKKYPKGEVGRWLHSKAPGDTIEVRGPLKTWPWKKDVWDEIVMISGGTGITPFFQLFNNVIRESPSSSNTQFTLLHSSRIPSELPPPFILDPMVTFAANNPEKFKLHIFVDEEDGSTPPTTIPKRLAGRITESTLKSCMGSEEQPTSWWNKRSHKSAPQEKRRILFLVCGPEPMIGAVAGPYGRNLSQAPVSGILGNMGYKSTEVYKL